MSNANKVVSGSFAATGSSNTITPLTNSAHAACVARVNITISGTFVGTILVERTFDDGATWVGRTVSGTAISYTAPVSEYVEESEGCVRYRLRCSAYTSGTATYRLSV